jgi:hypothetical protein
MHLLAQTLSFTLALDGESATGSNTDVAIISVASMLAGYVLLAGLWFFVFREKARSKRRRDSPPE